MRTDATWNAPATTHALPQYGQPYGSRRLTRSNSGTVAYHPSRTAFSPCSKRCEDEVRQLRLEVNHYKQEYHRAFYALEDWSVGMIPGHEHFEPLRSIKTQCRNEIAAEVHQLKESHQAELDDLKEHHASELRQAENRHLINVTAWQDSYCRTAEQCVSMVDENYAQQSVLEYLQHILAQMQIADSTTENQTSSMDLNQYRSMEDTEISKTPFPSPCMYGSDDEEQYDEYEKQHNDEEEANSARGEQQLEEIEPITTTHTTARRFGDEQESSQAAQNPGRQAPQIPAWSAIVGDPQQPSPSLRQAPSSPPPPRSEDPRYRYVAGVSSSSRGRALRGQYAPCGKLQN